MKYLIAICFALLAVAAAEKLSLHNLAHFKQARDECTKANKVPPELHEKYENTEYPDDEITRCYVKCMFEKFDAFDPKKGLNVNTIIAHLNSTKNAEIKKKVVKCADNNKQKSDTCTWVYRAFKCFLTDKAISDKFLKLLKRANL